MKPAFLLFLLFLFGCQNMALNDMNNAHDDRGIGNQSKIEESILPSNYDIVGFSDCPIGIEGIQTLIDVKNGVLIPNSSLGKTDNNIPLSISEMNEWLRVSSRIENLYPPAVFNIDDQRKVYFFIFDGTWNDKDKDQHKTVSAKLYDQLVQLQEKDSRIHVNYYSGVGTRTSLLNRLWEGATGNGSEERAKKALDELKNVETANKPHIYSIGFSRGAATARHFLNLVDEYYFEEENFSPFEKSLFSKPRLYSMLFDTVATGQLSTLKLEIPQSVISTIHFVATSEERTFFPVTRIPQQNNSETLGQQLLEVDLPGVHSDIGGGYGDSLEKLTLFLANTWLNKQGIHLPAENQDFQAILNMGKNDSRWLQLGNPNRNTKRKESATNTTELSAMTNPEMGINVAKTLEMTILVATGANQRLLRQKQDIASGKKKTFQGLAINLYPKGNSLTVSTNCPDSISINKNKGTIDVLGQPFIPLTPEYLNRLRSTYGLINTYPAVKKKNYISRI